MSSRKRSAKEGAPPRPRLRRRYPMPTEVIPGMYFGDDDDDTVRKTAREPERPRNNGNGITWGSVIYFIAEKVFIALLVLVVMDRHMAVQNRYKEGGPSTPPMLPPEPLLSEPSPLEPPLLGRNMTDTELIARFWYDFDQIMSAVDEYETWFDTVNNATGVLDEIYAEIPPHWQEQDPELYNELGVNIEGRRLHLQYAEIEYQRFCRNREKMLLSMLGEETLLRVFVEGQPITMSRAGDLRMNWNKLMWRLGRMKLFSHLVELANSSTGHHDEGDTVFNDATGAVVDAKDRMAITLAARSVTEELIQMNANLFEYESWAFSQLHLLEAQKLENMIIRDILYRSQIGFTWKGYHGASLYVLRGRVDKIQRAHKIVRETLVWLEERFVLKTHEMVTDWDLWLQSAKELLGGWAVATHDTQEAVIYMLRRRDAANKDPPRACAEASWREWKERNCGATSCYDDIDIRWRFRIWFGARKKPRAKVAGDEAAWIENVLMSKGELRVPRKVYDKACCQKETRFHDRLKHGKCQPKMGFRL